MPSRSRRHFCAGLNQGLLREHISDTDEVPANSYDTARCMILPTTSKRRLHYQEPQMFVETVLPSMSVAPAPDTTVNGTRVIAKTEACRDVDAGENSP